MIWLHRRKSGLLSQPRLLSESRLPKPKEKANLKLMELRAAKEILAEIFNARPEDIEDMIKSRIEERSWADRHVQESDELWPVAFCLGE